MQELTLTLTAITDVSVRGSLINRPGISAAFTIELDALFPNEGPERRLRIPLRLRRQWIELENSRFHYGDSEQLYEEITRRALEALFAGRLDTFGTSFQEGLVTFAGPG